MAAFGDSVVLCELENIRISVAKLRQNLGDLRKLQSDVLSDPVPDQSSKSNLNEAYSNIRLTAKAAKHKLIEIGHQLENPSAPVSSGVVTGTALRIQRNQHRALSEQLMLLMTEYNELQTTYNDKCKSKLKRQLDITGVHLDDVQIEELMSSTETSSKGVFASQIMSGNQAQQTLREAQDRQHEIVKLENDIRDLHEMFIDISTLISEQGDSVNRIEDNVNSAVVQIETGNKELNTARLSKISARKKKFCCLIVSIVIVVVIILILAIVLSK